MASAGKCTQAPNVSHLGQTDHLQIIPTVRGLDLSRQIDHLSPILYDLSTVAQFANPYNLHDLQ